MRSREIRRSFLEYFEQNGHPIVPSSSLVPHDDPTLLFTNAGMNQFKDVFLGREKRAYRRATTSQKCMRVSGKHNDLDNVGPSLRHHTFFEMLGNFSFGDYFKKEAIPFAWELLTTVWQLPPDRLYPTIFKGEAGIPRDDEALRDLDDARAGRPDHRAGPRRELLADGRHRALRPLLGDPLLPRQRHPVRRGSAQVGRAAASIAAAIASSRSGTTCSWSSTGSRTARCKPLPAPSIDTGMGLERITAVIQGKLSNYDTDLFTPILDAIGERAGTSLRRDARTTIATCRCASIADHLRAMTFLIADGVVPSNEWRGYVLRKIMRRAMRHGKKLGFTEPFLHALVDVVVARDGRRVSGAAGAIATPSCRSCAARRSGSTRC